MINDIKFISKEQIEEGSFEVTFEREGKKETKQLNPTEFRLIQENLENIL